MNVCFLVSVQNSTAPEGSTCSSQLIDMLLFFLCVCFRCVCEQSGVDAESNGARTESGEFQTCHPHISMCLKEEFTVSQVAALWVFIYLSKGRRLKKGVQFIHL